MVFNSKNDYAMPTDTKLHKLKPKNRLYQVNGRNGLDAVVTAGGSVSPHYDNSTKGRQDKVAGTFGAGAEKGLRGYRMADSTRALLRLLPAVPLAGCSGAPSLTVAGAYFPTWIACALIAVAVAALARLVMVKTGLALLIPFQLAVNLALGVLVGLALWLAWGGA